MRKVFPKKAEMLGMLEVARFEDFPQSRFVVPGDFVKETFAVVLVGGVIVNDANVPGSMLRLGPGEGFGAAPGAIAANQVITAEPTDLLIFTMDDWYGARFCRLHFALA